MSSDTPLTIRRFMPPDLVRVAEIAKAERVALDYVSPAGLIRLRRRCFKHSYVAEMDGRIVGFMITCVEPQKRYLKAHIVALAVDAAYRRHGIGRSLTECTMAALANPAIALHEAEIRADNVPSITLAEKYGFVRSGVKTRFYRDGADAVIMRRWLRDMGQGPAPNSSTLADAGVLASVEKHDRESG